MIFIRYLKEYSQRLKEPLFRNATFITFSSLINAALGFVFWITVGRLYSVEDVGQITALMASLDLVILLSKFGFDYYLIRFLPTNDRIKVFESSLTITTLIAFLVGMLYLMVVNQISIQLAFIRSPIWAIIFLVVVLAYMISIITGIAFIAIRRGDFYFYQTTIMSTRIILLFILAPLGKMGIFISIGFAYMVASLFSLSLLKRFNLSFGTSFSLKFIKNSLNFSFYNYVASILYALPNFILPILVLNILGAQDSARYYLSFTMGSLLLVIPTALSASLFVEGSHGEDLRKNVISSSLAIYLLLIPTSLFLYFFGDFALGLLKKEYLESFDLLRMMTLSSLFFVVYIIFNSIQNVRIKVKSIALVSSLRSILLLGSSYILISKYDLIGIGYAWIFTNGIVAALIISAFVRKMDLRSELFKTYAFARMLLARFILH